MDKLACRAALEALLLPYLRTHEPVDPPNARVSRQPYAKAKGVRVGDVFLASDVAFHERIPIPEAGRKFALVNKNGSASDKGKRCFDLISPPTNLANDRMKLLPTGRKSSCSYLSVSAMGMAMGHILAFGLPDQTIR